MPLIDRTKLTALLGNLVPSFVSDSKKMKDSILVVHDTMDANYNEMKAFQTGVGSVIDGGFFTDTPTDTVDGGTFL